MPRRYFATIVLMALLGTRSGLGQDAAPTDDQLKFFETQVRPVLANNCLKCHGPAKQKGGLRLDSRAALLAGGDTGPVVVPGKPEESLLIEAVRHEADGPKMPPSKKLPDPAIADLTRWVAMGAPWPGTDDASAAPPPRKGELQVTAKDRAHWAFRPLVRPPVPAVKDGPRVVNPIDAFLQVKRVAKGLKPNPPATKQELVRRVAYDLTGLPPTPEMVDAFLADRSPTAYEALVDRLLDSPRYGEAWGRHWLDLVRFAETNSYERDNPKPNAWRYRDYVINAFNQDKPYNQFVREQLAGDELPDAGHEAVIATGYYRLGIWDDEPADRDQARYDGLDDILATTSQVFLGLTVDCARCHDHKLDPIPQKDYYRLLAFFHNINPFRNGGPTDEAPLFASLEAHLAFEQRVQTLNRQRDETRAAILALETEFRTRSEETRRQRLQPADLDELTYRYYRDTWDVLPDFAALKPEDSGTLPGRLFDIRLRTRDDAFGFVFEGALIVPKAGAYTFYLDSDDGARLTVGDRKVAERDGIHGLGEEQIGQLELKAGRVPIRLEYFQRYNRLGLRVAWSGPEFGRRTLAAPDSGAEERDDSKAPIDVPKLIREQGAKVLGADRVAEYRRLERAFRQIEGRMLPMEAALCVTEPGPVAPETFVLLRGNPHVKGDPVEPAFPLVLGPAVPVPLKPEPGPRSSGRRRALADWIVSPANPIAARVMANRVWQYHFGRGIVRSSNNFGLQGDKPTHEELLNWLAAEFTAQGWRLKPLHRLIVTSDAYKMSSRADAEALKRDPINDLFWRFDMRRLSAEEVRDSILALSGTLNLKMGGPGVYPEIPPEVLAGQSQPGKGWTTSTPEEQARRSVYVHVKRSLPLPILESFDGAEFDRSAPVRFATTQPTQALAMMNGTFLNRQAEALAARLRREAGPQLGQEVTLALRLATSRTPGAGEVRRGLDLIAALKTRDGLDDAAALRAFCLTVLNLNELIYLD